MRGRNGQGEVFWTGEVSRMMELMQCTWSNWRPKCWKEWVMGQGYGPYLLVVFIFLSIDSLLSGLSKLSFIILVVVQSSVGQPYAECLLL